MRKIALTYLFAKLVIMVLALPAMNALLVAIRGKDESGGGCHDEERKLHVGYIGAVVDGDLVVVRCGLRVEVRIVGGGEERGAGEGNYIPGG